MKKILLTLTLILLLTPNAYAQQHCQADFDCDGSVYPSDLMVFLAEYGSTDCTSCPSQSTPCEGTLSPLGRWCDQGDGTVKDMTTGLVWLKDASCMGNMDWYAAIEQPITNLRSGDCSGTLTDGSVWGDWRLPTKTELEGITIGDEYIRDNQMYSFTGVQSHDYWSSTTNANSPDLAWLVNMNTGDVLGHHSKSHGSDVWPVRDGQ